MSFRRLIGFYLTGEFGRFLLAGGTAAAANFASRFAFQPLLGFNASVVAAYSVGFLTAFFLNRRFVFPASGKPMRQEMAWFFVFNALAFPVVWIASVALRDFVFGRFLPAAHAEALAHGIAILLPVAVNFAAHKLITFARR